MGFFKSGSRNKATRVYSRYMGDCELNGNAAKIKCEEYKLKNINYNRMRNNNRGAQDQQT
jgi:hypothetical protein